MLPVRVLIVDDSSFFRKRLSEIIARDPRLEVVGMANNGLEAVAQITLLKPDIISMDIEMPIMDGISAVRKIMTQRPTPILMLSTWTTEGAKSTLEALEAGAVDYLPKRFQDISDDTNLMHQQLCQRLYDLATNSRTNNLPSAKNTAIFHPTRPPNSATAKHATTDHIRLVAIGTSTGGPVALQAVLSQLPSDFPHPILLIQHMPAAFTPSFAQRLNAQCKITVKQAVDGDRLAPGTAYLAPGGMQMLIKGTKRNAIIEIRTAQSDQTYKPSIDLTLESLIPVCPAETLVIILTGMGADGREACKKLRPLGVTIWAQDQQSSTIYGMPMVIAKAGLADRILSLYDIGHHLAEIR